MTIQEQQVTARLQELGIAVTRHEHPPVATVDEAEQYWADIDATHCKNLFLRNQSDCEAPRTCDLPCHGPDLDCSHMSDKNLQIVGGEWITFPGGELEGKHPNTLCATCRYQLKRAAAGQSANATRPRALCFQCYRAELDSACGPREHSESSSGAARASGGGAPRAVENVRWQWLLPFEPVNKPRLERLKAERAVAHATMVAGAGRYADKRRHAQIAARHALDAIAAGLHARQLAPAERDRLMSGAIHAAELQLPESWLPFVVAR